VESNYRRGYGVLRDTTASHGNAFLRPGRTAPSNGPQKIRDDGIALMLTSGLQRPRLDITVDLRGEYPACGDAERACFAIPNPAAGQQRFPVAAQPVSASMGWAMAAREGAGLDYLLPYWMARYYGVVRE